MPIMTQNSKIKLMCGGRKISRMYCQGSVIYSSGNIVTYHVDNGVTYQEEVDEGASCLSPKTFTPTKSGWEFVGWRSDATTNAHVYSSYAMGDNPVTLYAVFRQAVTVTYYDTSAAANTSTGYRYYNNGNVTNPSFTLTQAALSGWTARGWSTSNAGNSDIAYENGVTFTRDSDVTLYGLYQQTITVTYNGNSNTGGSTEVQTGTRYWAPAGYINPSFILRENGFTRTGASFVVWAANGIDGTQYAAGAAITLMADTTMYARWLVSQSSPCNIERPYKSRGDWTSSVTITSQHFINASITGKLYADVGKDEDGNYGRCDVILYANDVQIDAVYTYLTATEKSVSKSLEASTGLTITLSVRPHSYDIGTGSFFGTVTYTILV